MAFDRKSHILNVGKSTRFKPNDPRLIKGNKKLLSGDAGTKLRVTVEKFDELMQEANGVCLICKKPPSKNRLAVDHDHKTGKIRGLLCFRCNYGLSWFSEDPVILQRAVDYLRR